MTDPSDQTPTDKAIDDEDRIWARIRHDRRMKLMRADRDIARLETRMYFILGITAVLAIVATVLSFIT